MVPSYGTHFKGLQIDLAYMTEEEISMYADDHQIFASGLSTSIVGGKLLQKEIRSLNDKGKLATSECSEISIYVTGL